MQQLTFVSDKLDGCRLILGASGMVQMWLTLSRVLGVYQVSVSSLFTP